uniref:Uncharacterized protein n=1 Tax=Rhizophora mucronata TaxID=61149 RepID=A0A2P2NT00_RHIMU
MVKTTISYNEISVYQCHDKVSVTQNLGKQCPIQNISFYCAI